MKTIKFLSIIAAVAVIFNSCSKGDTGATGPAGANGTNGVANITSNQFTVTPGSWGAVAGGFTYSYTDVAITNYNNDEVQVYFNLSSGANWAALPVSNLYVSGDEMGYSYNNGIVQVAYAGASAPTNTFYFKVVVIPPAINVKYPNTNWKNWSEVNAIIQAQNTAKE